MIGVFRDVDGGIMAVVDSSIKTFLKRNSMHLTNQQIYNFNLQINVQSLTY